MGKENEFFLGGSENSETLEISEISEISNILENT